MKRGAILNKENIEPSTSIAERTQGYLISPTLINFTLNGLEKAAYDSILSLTKSKERRIVIKHADGTKTRIGSALFIVRYADDFVVLARSKHLLATYVKPAIQSFLTERGLELSLEKTKVFSLKDGHSILNFLGYVFKYNTN